MIDLTGKSLAAMAIPFIGGWAGSMVQRRNMDKFYWKLNRPWWNPPKLAFPIVWTYLYGTMGYASYLVYRDGGGFDGAAKIPLAIYAGQMLVNWAFTPLFFGARKIGWAAVDTVTLWFGVALTMKSFYEVNETAGNLLIPYQAWVSLASALSIWIWKNNDPKKLE